MPVPIQKIQSKNAAYQKFEVLQTNRNKRHKYNEFLVEGVRNINEAIRNNWKIKSFLYSAGTSLSAWAEDLLAYTKTEVNYALTSALMDDLSKKEVTSEIMAIVQMRSAEETAILPTANPLIALFDRPSNKGNLGTLIRSCDAFGVDGLIITGHSVDLYDPDVISSSMGSFFRIPVIRLTDNNSIDLYSNQLRKQHPTLQIIGTTSHKQQAIQDVDLTTPVLFLIGNETDGLNQHFLSLCDTKATIPMASCTSASSFNVSCAATVLFYEANRQRGFDGFLLE